MQCVALVPKGFPMTRLRAENFVMQAGKYESSVMIHHDQCTVNGKSMLGLLSLGVIEGAIELVVEGTDENEAANALKALLMQ